jgi:Ser/Thr protein kinase RdoA (MazF antagonist)
MGLELAEPDWPPLTAAETAAVLARYPIAGVTEGAGAAGSAGVADGTGVAGGAGVRWHSPRPMSAAGIAGGRAHAVFVKRHDRRVRTAGQLAVEHALAGHLRAAGMAVPAVLRAADGATVVTRGRFVYEVHELAPGADSYRDAVSWSPFRSLGHAHAAGAMLARLHRAAAGFAHPPRPLAVLMSSCEIITAADPLAALDRILTVRPGLARYLAGRRWQDDLTRYHLPAIRRAAPLLARMAPRWGHGDWHPSNLMWTGRGPRAAVAAIIDLGLANRTFAVHDLAVALERSTVAWLGLPETGRAGADLDAVGALLDGYASVSPLRRAQTAALAAVLPVAHLEYALSEVEYFADVVGSPANAALAYDGYLVGHARWFEGRDGAALLDHLRRWRRRPS